MSNEGPPNVIYITSFARNLQVPACDSMETKRDKLPHMTCQYSLIIKVFPAGFQSLGTLCALATLSWRNVTAIVHVFCTTKLTSHLYCIQTTFRFYIQFTLEHHITLSKAKWKFCHKLCTIVSFECNFCNFWQNLQASLYHKSIKREIKVSHPTLCYIPYAL